MSVNIFHGGPGGYRVGSPYYPTPDVGLDDVYQIIAGREGQKREISFELRGTDEELRRYVREEFADSPYGLNENFRILMIPKGTRLHGFSYIVLDGETGVSGSFALEVDGDQTELVAATSLATTQTHHTWSEEVTPADPIILEHNGYIVWTPTALPTGGLPALKRLRFLVHTYSDNPNEAH
jgi:hypothetical protein